MRISDWSSDVCSSDLRHDTVPQLETRRGQAGLRKEAGAVDDGADSEVRRDPFHQRLGFGGVGQVDRHRHKAGPERFRRLPERQTVAVRGRTEEHTSELQSIKRNSKADLWGKKKK